MQTSPTDETQEWFCTEYHKSGSRRWRQMPVSVAVSTINAAGEHATWHLHRKWREAQALAESRYSMKAVLVFVCIGVWFGWRLGHG